MHPARQSVGKAAFKIRIERRGNSPLARGVLPANRTNLGGAQARIYELRRISRHIDAHHLTPSMFCRGYDIDLSRGYKSAEGPLAPNSIPLGTVFVFLNAHFMMPHTAS